MLKTTKDKIAEKKNLIAACNKRIQEENRKLEKYEQELLALEYNEIQNVLMEHHLSTDDLKELLKKPVHERNSYVKEQLNEE